MEKELLECALKRHWKNVSVSSVVSVESSPGATKDQGYLSEVARLRLRVLLGNGRSTTRSVILKTDNAQHCDYTKFVREYEVFKVESMFYSTVLKEMEYLMEEFEDADGLLWCKLIHYVPYSCLVLEDLKAFGFNMLDGYTFFDLEHSLLAVNSLGRYHGMSKVLEDRGVISSDGYKKFFVFHDSGMHRLWFQNIKAVKEGVKKHWESSWGSIVDKIKITIEELLDRLKALDKINESCFKVLNHGDCHKYNVMFKYDWRNRPVDMRFLDFQIPCYGSPCMDLTYMLYLGMDPLVRRDHSRRLVKVYHSSLIRTLERYQFVGVKPSLQEIEEIMDEYSFFGLYMAVFVYGILFIEDENPEDDQRSGEYSPDLFRSESFKRILGPDLETFVKKFCG